jgi:NADH-quinone oxidoreductase subunit C
MAELTNEHIIARLAGKFSDDTILNTEESYGMLTFTVNKSRVLDILKFLYNDSDLGFTFLTDLTGVHYPQPNDELGVVYHLHNLPRNKRIRLKAFFPKAKPEIDSATPVFESANWMERETYDFFGINFIGHPNLKRILNVDDLGYFPLRKEYALEDPTRTDKNDAMFGR